MAEKFKILIVEDSPVIVGMLSFMLRREGHEPLVAEDGRAAREFLTGGVVPDAVILDILLPYVDGFELLAEMRTMPAWRKVPIIMLSAKSQERDVVRALDLGADDYIIKPLRPMELAARLRRLLKQPS
ncbi:response regulator transcription factor [Thiovibrio sp. JS02]